MRVILCLVERPDLGKTNPAQFFGRFIAIPVFTNVTSLDFKVMSTDALISYPISES